MVLYGKAESSPIYSESMSFNSVCSVPSSTYSESSPLVAQT